MSTATAWRAEWTAASGQPVWTEFRTEAQADLFALRKVGAVVDVTPVVAPVLDRLPTVAAADLATPSRDALPDAETFAAVVDGAPAQTPGAQRLCDVVAGLRRTVAPSPSAEFTRALRARLGA